MMVFRVRAWERRRAVEIILFSLLQPAHGRGLALSERLLKYVMHLPIKGNSPRPHRAPIAPLPSVIVERADGLLHGRARAVVHDEEHTRRPSPPPAAGRGKCEGEMRGAVVRSYVMRDE